MVQFIRENVIPATQQRGYHGEIGDISRRIGDRCFCVFKFCDGLYQFFMEPKRTCEEADTMLGLMDRAIGAAVSELKL